MVSHDANRCDFHFRHYIFLRSQPEISYNQATEIAQKQLKRVLGPNTYSAYKNNWVIQTYIEWYKRGHLIGGKRIYIVRINLTPNLGEGVESKNFEILVDTKSGETLSVLQYNDMYNPPF